MVFVCNRFFVCFPLLGGGKAWGDIYKEIIFMSSIEHEFIIAYYGCYLSDLSVWVRPPDQTVVTQTPSIARHRVTDVPLCLICARPRRTVDDGIRRRLGDGRDGR